MLDVLKTYWCWFHVQHSNPLKLCLEVSEQLCRGAFPLCPCSVVIDWLVSPLLFGLVWPFGVGFLHCFILHTCSSSASSVRTCSPVLFPNELVVIPSAVDFILQSGFVWTHLFVWPPVAVFDVFNKCPNMDPACHFLVHMLSYKCYDTMKYWSVISVA